MGILSKQNIHVAAEYDQVLLMIGRLTVNMPYATSFRIAQGIRLAAKDAMRYAKEDVAGWNNYAQDEDIPERTSPYLVSADTQITVQKGFTYKVGWDGENVVMLFGNNRIELHFTTALKVNTWLRVAGAEAKAWAGDSGRSMNASGILSDAEDNYRLGI
jgi:hypothetical protein